MLGGADDPFPLHTKKALSDMGIDYGSLESVHARAEAARMIARESSCQAESPRSIGSAGTAYKARSLPADSKQRSQTMPVRRWRDEVAQELDSLRSKRTKTGPW